jgi:hypothetical protein
MPVRYLTENDIDEYKGKKYPNPFFDLSQNFLPRNIKTLFKFCKTFYYTNEILRNVISKMTEYPITDIIYDTSIEPDIKELYAKAFKKEIRLKNLLIEIGLDYYTYGNCFVSAFLKQKRFLACNVCGTEAEIASMRGVKLKKFVFQAICEKCGHETPMNIKDEPLTTISSLKFVRWSPENIDIDYNPISGNARYYYAMPNKIKQGILVGNMAILEDIPAVFLEALKKKKKIMLDNNNLYHFKAPTLAEEDMGWGKPRILAALRLIYYQQTLKRGNEAIANDHIVPKKLISPANTGAMDPYSMMNLGKWRANIEEQVKKWRSDPNHVGIFPIPVQYQELGGNARSLLLTPEMKFLEENVINSIGVPVEFIKGGTSWTGSSISLRIVENGFLTYREDMLDFINYFVIDKIVTLLKYPSIEIQLKKFKMSDDSQSKQLSLQLNELGALSASTLLQDFGYSAVEEEISNTKENSAMIDQGIKKAIREAEAQGQATVIMTRYQARAQKAAEDELLRLRAEVFEKELMEENAGSPIDPYEVIEKYAKTLMFFGPEEQTQAIQEISKTAPVTANLVMERLNYYMQAAEVSEIGAQGTQTEPNQKTPGQRNSNKVKTGPEKTKGQTRGTP